MAPGSDSPAPPPAGSAADGTPPQAPPPDLDAAVPDPNVELPAGWTAADPSFEAWAEARRRTRIRNEIIGGAVLIVFSFIVGVLLHTTAFVILALLAAGALLAYEFLVSSME